MRASVTDLRTIYQQASVHRRRQLLAVTLLIPLTAAAEMLLVIAIVPVLALLGGNSELSINLPVLADWVPGAIGSSPLRSGVIVFILAAALTGLLRLALNWSTLRLGAGLGHDLNMAIQQRLLHQPYLFHASANSSRFLASLDKVDHLVLDLVVQAIQAAGAFIIAAAVIFALIQVDPLSAAAAAALAAALYGTVLLVVRGRFAMATRMMTDSYDRRIQLVQEALGGIRDVILDRSQSARLSEFEVIDRNFMRSRAETSFLATAPRFVVEAIGLGLIALLALYVAARPGGLPAALPVLGALALGAQRLLPLTSQIYGGWIHLSSSSALVGEVAALLRLPLPSRLSARDLLPFDRAITFDLVGFHYPGRDRPALHEISLAIPKGSRVAIVGRSGSGKSTLADLLMGLLEPTEGQIRVDGELLTGAALEAWRGSVSHVPQSIFLADASIARNIALGAPNHEPDRDRLVTAASAAQLGDFIAALADGYDSRVGERGAMLSGGQRQRLALARAIYRQAPLMVLDEATSALDDGTEAAILSALDGLHAEGTTIAIIAHRLSTVERCDLVFVLDEGRLVQSGSFAEVFGHVNRLHQLRQL